MARKWLLYNLLARLFCYTTASYYTSLAMLTIKYLNENEDIRLLTISYIFDYTEK